MEAKEEWREPEVFCISSLDYCRVSLRGTSLVGSKEIILSFPYKDVPGRTAGEKERFLRRLFRRAEGRILL